MIGERVFQRCPVLLLSLEDNENELRRRIRAARIHYGISREELKRWLFIVTPEKAIGKIMKENGDGELPGALVKTLEAAIIRRSADIACIDPFVKSHAVGQNNNSTIDGMMEILGTSRSSTTSPSTRRIMSPKGCPNQAMLIGHVAAPLAAGIREIANQFLLLGINGDGRLTARQRSFRLLVDVAKLPIAIGVIAALAGFAIGL